MHALRPRRAASCALRLELERLESLLFLHADSELGQSCPQDAPLRVAAPDAVLAALRAVDSRRYTAPVTGAESLY